MGSAAHAAGVSGWGGRVEVERWWLVAWKSPSSFSDSPPRLARTARATLPIRGGSRRRGDAGLAQPFQDLLLGHGADLHRAHLAALDQHHGRDAAYAVARARG